MIKISHLDVESIQRNSGANIAHASIEYIQRKLGANLSSVNIEVLTRKLTEPSLRLACAFYQTQELSLREVLMTAESTGGLASLVE
ncbi:TPA: hypothetical protein ACX6RM_001339 [Photobacterium damselae]